MNRCIWIMTLLVAATVASPASTIVNFDDLSGSSPVADGYGGINWGGVWTHYSTTQQPYTAHSPMQRIFSNVTHGVFTFASPVTFEGAWFAGSSIASVQFRLYFDGNLVAASDTLTVSSVARWLSSGYVGSVDKVDVYSASPGYFVMDDVTYGGSAVPEPTTMGLLAGGLAGLALLRRRKA